jgi:dynein intermediate chain
MICSDFSPNVSPKLTSSCFCRSIPATTLSPGLTTTATSTDAPLQPVPSPPPPPKVYYDKSIQTSTPSSDLSLPSSSLASPESGPNSTSGGATRESAEEMRSRIMAELQLERQQLDAEIAEERRVAKIALEEQQAQGLSEVALSSLLASSPFMDFLEKSSKVVQRALADPYDYMRDYSLSTNEENAQQGGEKVRLLGSWHDKKWAKGRSVTGVDWSHKVSDSSDPLRPVVDPDSSLGEQFPELFVASYNRTRVAMNEPDGIVAVWNLHLLERPEFIFHAQVGE